MHYWLSAVLWLIGLHGILTRTHFVRKLMAMNVMQVAVIIFFIALSAKSGGTVPIAVDHGASRIADAYINPLPHALMLTAIVVSVSTTGVALALLIRIHRRYDTLEEPELLERMRE
jgi:multicomponent Na+:H+ antiporter subunit C